MKIIKWDYGGEFTKSFFNDNIEINFALNDSFNLYQINMWFYTSVYT